jgi:glycerol uptake facilitator-like aquaporin
MHSVCIFSHPPALWNTAKTTDGLGSTTAYTAYSYTQPADSASIASSAARTMANIAKPCLVEFIGTFFLTLTIGTAAGQGASLAPLAIGSTLVCAIYWGGHMSGANFNPAVSLAVCIRGKLTPVL